MGVAVEFRILGPLEVVGSAGQLTKVPPRERVVLGMLLLEAERVVPVDRLIDAVWDESPPSTARKQILICVSVLRRLLGGRGLGGAIVSRAPGYAIELGDRDRLDLAEFEAHAAAGRNALAQDRPGDAAEAFRRAAELWRGDPLGGLTGRLTDAAGVRLTERLLSVAEAYADVRLRLRAHHGLVEDLRELTAAHPLRETLHTRLMRALLQQGRPAEAMAAYRTVDRALMTELGLTPGAELRALRAAILAPRTAVLAASGG
jgi:DNA-binding SARP family transcriptional activator